MASNEQEVKKFEVTVTASLHHQLLHLARHSPYGPTVAAVAQAIIAERVIQLMGADFAKTLPPFDRPPSTLPPAGATFGEQEPQLR